MKARLPHKLGQDGFSLIEIMIAILVFTVGALALATMQGTAIWGNSLGRDYTEATTIGAAQLDSLATLRYTATVEPLLLTDANGNGTAGLTDGFGAAVVPDHQTVSGNYAVFWNIANNQFIPETKTVALYVTWRDRGMTHSVRMRGLIPMIHGS